MNRHTNTTKLLKEVNAELKSFSDFIKEDIRTNGLDRESVWTVSELNNSINEGYTLLKVFGDINSAYSVLRYHMLQNGFVMRKCRMTYQGKQQRCVVFTLVDDPWDLFSF